MSSSLGKIVEITSFGESHGPYVGAVLQGIPSGINIDMKEIQTALDLRKPKADDFSTTRKEKDEFQIISGIFENKSTGAPITILIENADVKSKDYGHLKDKFRPGHADFTYAQKYGHRDYRGGGRSSIRVWAPIVAAGDICRQYIQSKMDVSVHSFVFQVGELKYDPVELKRDWEWRENALSSVLRFPRKMEEESILDYIRKIKKEGDTLGGAIHSSIMGLPRGLGEPIFEKLQSKLAQYLMNINTIKAIEFGEGFDSASFKGSQFNDNQDFINNDYSFNSNHAGGSLGGISTGEDVTINMAFKPISSIAKPQEILDKQGKKENVSIGGRHDIFALPRAVPIVDAMIYLAIADLYMLAKD